MAGSELDRAAWLVILACVTLGALGLVSVLIALAVEFVG